MKVTINGCGYHRQYSWDDKPIYEIWNDDSWGGKDRVMVMPHSFEVEIPDDFDPTPEKIRMLRAEKQRIQAEAHVKAENIEAQIQELLCIEDKSNRCPQCKSDNIHDLHGFTADNIETFYKSCEDCGHQWGQE